MDPFIIMSDYVHVTKIQNDAMKSIFSHIICKIFTQK